MTRARPSASMIGVYTGPRHAGKTTRLAALCREWRAAGRGVDGFLSPSRTNGLKNPSVRHGGDEDPAGYDLFDIKTETVRPFLRRAGTPDAGRTSGGGPGGERIGPWILLSDGLARAGEIIRRASPDDLLVVDEFGPLELQGGGVRAALDEALKTPGRRVLVVVREELRGAFLETYGAAGAKIYEARYPGVGEDLTRDLFGGTV